MTSRNKQQGTALIVGLIVLIVLTLLGTTAMRMSRNELMMSGMLQFFARAFHAAEASVAAQLADRDFSLAWTAPSNPHTHDQVASTQSIGTSHIQFLDSGPVPAGGFSLNKKFSAHHFEITAQGLSPTTDGAASPDSIAVNIRQGIYLIGPSD